MFGANRVKMTGGPWGTKMAKAVVEDWDQLHAFLAAQPLCRWMAQKQHVIAMGVHADPAKSPIHPPPKKDDNAELAAALSSMA